MEGGGMGPAMDEVAAGVGTPTEGRERASSSPKSRGEASIGCD